MFDKEPMDEELLALAKEAIRRKLDGKYIANIEETAQNIAKGIAPRDELYNLDLVKMLLMTTYRVREIKAAK